MDLAALHLQNGKVVVLVAGDPFAMSVPAALVDFYQTTADYTLPWYDASFMRLIRLLAWAFGVFLRGLYSALTEVNPDLLPPALFDIVAGSHTGMPFTPILEVAVMILVIEIRIGPVARGVCPGPHVVGQRVLSLTRRDRGGADLGRGDTHGPHRASERGAGLMLRYRATLARWTPALVAARWWGASLLFPAPQAAAHFILAWMNPLARLYMLAELGFAGLYRVTEVARRRAGVQA